MESAEKKVYQNTTRPLDKAPSARYYNRNDKSDLGDDFVAPDGGWAWLVCVAAGVSNLSIYPCLQQFGFLFRERLGDLGMSSSQITAIINTNPAVSACTGLLNGPMFRRFTFRQVAMAGSLLISSGIVLTAFCETFVGYMVAYALLFGFGMGISVSASSLAINTYFQKKRRKAAGFSWTITGLGPIFLPYLVTFLLTVYGVQGTVKVVTIFDLDLLRDFTFVNLVAGLTIINFGELNFSILTPFILVDFGFETSQITLAMSLLAGLDITMRFLVPFLTEKIPWDNRVFFLIGVVGIALGRTVVACTRSYSMILCSFVWIGLCKGVRTIFWPLIIPGYVPLNRLPGASGLQLLISGLFTLICGPFVGLVRDRFNYSVTLHCLNMMSFVAAASWTLEALIRRHRRKQRLENS
ncbi:GL13011 [Drosophila persimilis]|uniref:GL13011 n=1 Tax=Drosophila persimilis TaxID=7234 RepID=B4GVE3_DROPE|nr:GL13011 [Drosophila persimilis]